MYNSKISMRLHENKVFIWDAPNSQLFQLCQNIMNNCIDFNIYTEKKFNIVNNHYVFKYKIDYNDGVKYFIKILNLSYTTEESINEKNDCTGIASNIVLMRTQSRINKESYYLVFSNDDTLGVSETNASKKINSNYKSYHSFKKCIDLNEQEVSILIETLNYLQDFINYL